ncbi:Yip1 family protein [Parabacteroides sp. Marseille-P3160]|uniref:Yip1 family protein n=1 Tax=Parabacteroides sp. Marseille-P3160 TaxID=1917887 RepID=UPI0009BC6611|nr:Yip1 family protein [Parabacteroides sp. Marseille-P3160]
MYKEILKWVIELTSRPAKAWEALSLRKDKDGDFLRRFIYPIIALITIAAFLGVLFTRKEFDFQLALKSAIKAFVTTAGGFYLGAYFLNEAWRSFFNQEKDMKLCQRFVGYSSSLMFALNIVLTLLPEFFFLQIFVLYTVMIVWEGAEPYMGVSEKDRMKFVAIATAIILLTPLLIGSLLFLLMPGLRF